MTDEWNNEATPIEDIRKALGLMQREEVYICSCHGLYFPYYFKCPLCGTEHNKIHTFKSAFLTIDNIVFIQIIDIIKMNDSKVIRCNSICCDRW